MSSADENLGPLDFNIGETSLTPEELGAMSLLDGLVELELEFSEKTKKEIILTDVQMRHARELQDASIIDYALPRVSERDPFYPHQKLLPVNAPYRTCVYRLKGTYEGQDQEIGGVRFITFASGAEEHFDVPVHTNGIARRPFDDFHAEVIRRLSDELYALKAELSLDFSLTKVVGPEEK